MLKTHWDKGCGRGKIVRSNIHNVNCSFCTNTPAFQAAVAEYKVEAEAAFQAQEPRTIVPQFGRVNDDGVMECFKCEGVLFRERPRSLFSYHFVCSNCGTSMHPMTETGMCT